MARDALAQEFVDVVHAHPGSHNQKVHGGKGGGGGGSAKTTTGGTGRDIRSTSLAQARALPTERKPGHWNQASQSGLADRLRTRSGNADVAISVGRKGNWREKNGISVVSKTFHSGRTAVAYGDEASVKKHFADFGLDARLSNPVTKDGGRSITIRPIGAPADYREDSVG